MIPDDAARRPDPDSHPSEAATTFLSASGRLGEIAQLLVTFRDSLSTMKESLKAMENQEVCGESAHGSIRIFFSPFGNLHRVEITSDFLKTAKAKRVEAALLEAFRRAQNAADEARIRFENDLTFMGVSVSQLRTESIKNVLPAPENIGEVFRKGDQRG